VQGRLLFYTHVIYLVSRSGSPVSIKCVILTILFILFCWSHGHTTVCIKKVCLTIILLKYIWSHRHTALCASHLSDSKILFSILLVTQSHCCMYRISLSHNYLTFISLVSRTHSPLCIRFVGLTNIIFLFCL
jgi:hypothetical protein